MRGVSTLFRATASLPSSYAVAGALFTGSAAQFSRRRLLQVALFGSRCEGTSSARRGYSPRSFQIVSFGVAGALFSASTAGMLSQEAYAKEILPAEVLPKDLVLYQYEACPFCNKVKAFLDYYGLQYKVVEVNPISKKEIKWSEYKKVPILMVDGDQLVDSSAIVDQLTLRLRLKKTDESVSGNEEEKWRRWVDDHLVHTLSPNIYRSAAEALESFDYITTNGNFSFTEKIVAKYAGAVAMYFVSKNLKTKYNITDERAALYSAAETWVVALGGRDFLGGSKPNLADLAVFGVLRPIRRLRTGEDMVANTDIGEWYGRMEDAVGASVRAKATE